MTFLRDSAVVLRTYRLGEADRIVVLLTQEHGKVRAVAKGVRRTSSKFGGRLEPLSHVALLLWQGRGELAVVNQAEVTDTYRSVREDLGRMGGGLSMLEVADQLVQEGHPDGGLYRMLVGALRVLSDIGTDPTMVVPAFFLRCSRTRAPSRSSRDARRAAAPRVRSSWWRSISWKAARLCTSCRRGRPLSPAALDVVRQVLGGSLGRVLSAPRPVCTDEVIALATEAMEAHLDRRLRATRTAASLMW